MTPCPAVHFTEGPCTLEAGHAGEHVWTNPENTPRVSMEAIVGKRVAALIEKNRAK